MNDLITFILFVFVSGMICNGWNIVTRIGMVFGFWEKYWEQYTQISHEYPAVFKFPEWIKKPISSCVICYASIYGTIIFVLTMAFSERLELEGIKTFFLWIGYMISLAYVNNFLHNKLTQK